jgi:hypothetical protein
VGDLSLILGSSIFSYYFATGGCTGSLFTMIFLSFIFIFLRLTGETTFGEITGASKYDNKPYCFY